MDPTYQQMMIQQLMQAGSMPAGIGGQSPATPYGQGMMTGNGMAMVPGQGVSPMTGQGMLGQAAPSQSLMQPMAAYASQTPAATGQMY